MNRRGGIASNFLTRRNGPKTSLLRTIKRRPARGSDEPVADATARRQSPATDDEPRSSTDESGDRPGLPLSSGSSDGGRSSSSTVDRKKRPARATRVRQHHGSGAAGDNRKKAASALTAAQGGNGGSGLSASSRRSAREPLAPSSSSPKRSSDEMQMQGGTDSHLQDDFGFVGSSQSHKRSKRENTYGSSQGQPSQQSRTYGQKHVKPDNKNKGSHDETHQSGFMNPVNRHKLDASEFPYIDKVPHGRRLEAYHLFTSSGEYREQQPLSGCFLQGSFQEVWCTITVPC
ncbi:hypothetical protein GP486_007791 [Trichoglossum hirsutum]|uniref:Uncharacterized protein n=1 Tax=Trichoglossum hirsutum TaxID=265104 RepID=A0A9P8IF86_9PEZI|nr:hypothetical protein GP486_007791 [Trichoglossum hirsutum]